MHISLVTLAHPLFPFIFYAMFSELRQNTNMPKRPSWNQRAWHYNLNIVPKECIQAGKLTSSELLDKQKGPINYSSLSVNQKNGTVAKMKQSCLIKFHNLILHPVHLTVNGTYFPGPFMFSLMREYCVRVHIRP